MIDMIMHATGMTSTIFVIDNLDLGIRAEKIEVIASKKQRCSQIYTQTVNNVIKAYESSTSWKVTAPFRAVSKLIKQVKV